MGSIIEKQMTEKEARKAIDDIRIGAGTLRDQVWAFHERKGFKALGYRTFGDCIKAELPFGRVHAYRLLAAKEIEERIKKMSPIGDISLPESHARALSELPENEQAAAYQEAVEASAGGKATARSVEEAVKKRLEPGPKPEPVDDDEAPPILDDVGNVVPDRLADVFTDGISAFKEIESAIQMLRRSIADLKRDPAAAHLGIQRLDIDLKNAWSEIKNSRPYAICPRGAGERWEKIGFLTKDQYKALPENLRCS